MKKVKKIVSLFLAVVMTLSMCLTVFAGVATSRTLTVKVIKGMDLKGATINAYKLFDFTKDADGKNYSYTVNTAYANAMKTALNTVDAKSETLSAALLGKTGDEYKTFAKAFVEETVKAEPALTPTMSKIVEASGKAAVESYNFEGLEKGFYLISVPENKPSIPEELYALVLIDDTDKEITLKGKTPSVTKKAKVGEDPVDENGVKIGDVITYTVEGVVPDLTGVTSYTYIIRDTLSNGLKFADENGNEITSGTTVPVTVKIGEVVISDITTADCATEAWETKGNNKPTEPTQRIQLNLSSKLFTGEVPNQTPAYPAGAQIEVTYKAVVTKDAIVKMENSAKLVYGNDSNNLQESTPSVVKTPTFPLNIRKAAADKSNPNNAVADSYLAGAEFQLYEEVGVDKDADGDVDEYKMSSTAIQVEQAVAGTDGSYNVLKDQIPSAATPANTTMRTGNQISGTSYNLHINGLKAGTYYLVETKAPDGYNKLEEPIKVQVVNYLEKGKDEEKIKNNEGFYLVEQTGDETSKTKTVLTVLNKSGVLIPDTGGMGSIIFTIIAVALVIGVGASYVISRRKPQE